MQDKNASLVAFTQSGIEMLRREDPHLYELLEREYDHQTHVLAMVAASSVADPSVLLCEAMVTSNVTTEGYPGARFHAGCKVIDEIEQMAIERARIAFHAQYANVQPHSGTSANEAVLFALLKPGDTILGLDLNSGGHLTHGAKASLSGQYFHSVGYGLTSSGFIDYDQVADLAQQFRPKLIICGASAYPRTIHFDVFRQIADAVGAFLLADISHIAGLVVTGEHPSPIDSAHFTTTSTYKQLYGPRGGLILIGKDAQSPAPDGRGTLADLIQRAVFPSFQGTPRINTIAAKARALAMVTTPSFKMLTQHIVRNARSLAQALLEKDYHVLTGGSDNHMVLVEVLSKGLTGVVAERALEECNMIVNKNRIPGDKKPATVTSGIRLGTNILALRGMRESEMLECSMLVDQVLSAITVNGEKSYELPAALREKTRAYVKELCRRFPLPHYPLPCEWSEENMQDD